MSANTLLLRLAGPMQSWGTTSRFQIRRTDHYPSKSGVLGLLLCAKGVCREDSAQELAPLLALQMAVRVDRPGMTGWDYHTAGGGSEQGRERAIGIRSADGKIKKTASTGKYETLLSRRQYLWDASFLVVLQGEEKTIESCVDHLREPVWPVFLGRKCCVPAEPVFEGTGEFDSPASALAKIPWRPRTSQEGRSSLGPLDCYVEHAPGTLVPDVAMLVHDVPRIFGYYSHSGRFLAHTTVQPPIGPPLYHGTAREQWADPYGPGWKELRRQRLTHDHELCVFCKSPAVEVHHLDYNDVRLETLRSLCSLCHEACTSMEYGADMRHLRIDPADPAERPRMLRQIQRLLERRRLDRRSELLSAGRGDFDE